LRQSYKAAVEGGLLGLGYGVSFGAGKFAGGLTAVGYGREKGNTQLAIVEETGLVGLFLYALLVFSLFTNVLTAYRRVGHKSEKALMAVLLGALTGSMVQSFFEAWWVAPGSPESAYFWALAGVSLGVSERIRHKYRQRLHQAKANRSVLSWQQLPAYTMRPRYPRNDHE
jgi:O-antigen ligase